MYLFPLTILALVATSIAAPNHIVEIRHITEIIKRQADVAQLLQLASLAGITALPSDPALLLSLGPLANSLASALPTPSVLSVLITAAPSGFVSSIVNDASYASSFESAFAAGDSPSWFNALPTDVKSYLHTYSGFGGLPAAAGAVESAASGAGTGTSGASVSGSGGVSQASGASGPSGSVGTSIVADSGTPSAEGSGSAGATAASGSTTPEASTVSPSSSSTGGVGVAPQPTGGVAAGVAVVVGILGVAIGI